MAPEPRYVEERAQAKQARPRLRRRNLRERVLERILHQGVEEGSRMTATIKDESRFEGKDADRLRSSPRSSHTRVVEFRAENNDEDFIAFTVKYFALQVLTN